MVRSFLNIVMIVLAMATSLQAQIQINSKVIDKESGKAIPFANISIANTTKGTISNQEGDFQLYIPMTGLNTRVLVSSLGYQSVSIHPKKVGKNIQLTPITYDLTEIKVTASKLLNDPKKILKECMKAAPGFKPDQPYINKGFLRQTHMLNNQYVKLIEAALITHSNPEDQNFKIHIKEKRNTYDKRSYHVKELQLFKYWDHMRYKKAKQKAKNTNLNEEEIANLIREQDEETNSLDKLIQINMAYQAKLPKISYSYCFDLNSISKYKPIQLKLDTILEQNDEFVYKIKILPTAKALKRDYFIHLGYLYISTKDYALYEIECAMLPNPNEKDSIAKRIIPSFANNFTIRYNRIKNKLYPSYYKYYDLDGTYSLKSLDKQPRIKRELLFTEIITQKDQISQMLPTQWNDKLYEDSEYHPEFWENYTILLETKDEAKLRKDLESEVSLKEQYQHATDSIRINQIN
ncbi:hypothetical protein DF185_18135 [Marinifilum breve]|uniref:Carboxypeptidase-like regulatory domain-containing protein n=1 Tax=Marinifilum breve TaxID=2184082 RepID=A0A2V4A7J2_9BACT|nr:carboxypeptidase-like regulatory domain-containing protein [Marinifilum breve]PXX97887.1 hypothetical protein DF185_18135 [Marinifilum breve]